MTHPIKDIALSIGFDACGLAKAEPLDEDALYLNEWISKGYHGSMSYLERNFAKRCDPTLLVPGCKTVIVLLLNYYPTETQNPVAPQIARYAYSQTDYHTVIKRKLSILEEQLKQMYGNDVINKDYQHSFVDSAPVLERRWAQKAGLGWIGKNKQLIHPSLGSYVFIASLMINLELEEYDQPIPARCGKCTKCIDACPTKALLHNGMDARKCISYLTIENKNDIPEEYRPLLNNKIIGCDICGDVCPWNKKWAKAHHHPELEANEEVIQWGKAKWQNLSPSDYKTYFNHSSIGRAGYDKLKRNIIQSEN
jgi:epoxyqueuosine reductase